MSIFNVELKKVVDDTYDIEIGYNLSDLSLIHIFKVPSILHRSAES